MACDVSQDEGLNSLVEELKVEAPRLDAVVHSIAFANREDLARPFIETSRGGFLVAHDVSAYSLVSVARAVSPLMSEGGSITTLTYIGARRVIPNYNVMGVAKAALEASMRYLASDLGPRGIRVNAISAGPVKTVSARAVKDFSSMLDYRGSARASAPEYGPGRGGRHGGVSRQRSGPRRYGQRAVRGRRLPDHGHVNAAH